MKELTKTILSCDDEVSVWQYGFLNEMSVILLCPEAWKASDSCHFNQESAQDVNDGCVMLRIYSDFLPLEKCFLPMSLARYAMRAIVGEVSRLPAKMPCDMRV